MESDKSYFNNIQIKNFGPINEANVDIAPLTVFVGPNSSGKSFAALLIHSLFNWEDISKSEFLNVGYKSLDYLEDNALEEFNKLASRVTDIINPDGGLYSNSFKIPNDDFESLINNGVGKFYSSVIEDKFKSYFNKDLSKLITLNNDCFKVSLNEFSFTFKENDILDKCFVMDDLHVNLIQILNNPQENQNLFKLEFNEDYVLVELSSLILGSIFEENTENFAEILYIIMSEFIFNALIREKSYYIPAARDVIVTDLEFSITQHLTGLVGFSQTQIDLLINLLKLNSESEEKYFYDLACKIESDITGIHVDIEKIDGKDKIIYRDNDDNVYDVDIVSTSVKELTPLILYLKYIVEPGDILIIEEPEAHIHPNNQRKLVQYFVEAINDGLNVILTTHSDFIIEQFNNLIRLKNSSLNPKDLGYSEKNILDYKDIKIYHFKEEDSYGFCATEVPINFTGFNDENFSEVVDYLYDQSDKIIRSKLR